MGKIGMLVACLMVMVTVGCNMNDVGTTVTSKNMQMALLNSGGQVATVAAIDSSGHKAQRITETKKIVVDVRKLVSEGEVGAITLGALQTQLNKIVPAKYHIYVMQIMAACNGVSVPTEKIGVDNIKRINEVLDGIQIRCERYEIALEKPEASPEGNRALGRTKAFTVTVD